MFNVRVWFSGEDYFDLYGLELEDVKSLKSALLSQNIWEYKDKSNDAEIVLITSGVSLVEVRLA
jgi:hypothetical protein